MAEVMSMIPEENAPGELNAEEQDSLQVGEELEAQHEQMLAGKYKSAEELESAYLELQKKLGADSDEPEEQTEEEEETNETSSDFLDRLWDAANSDDFSEEILQELSEVDPGELARMHLEYRSQQEQNAPRDMTEEDVSNIQNIVGGPENYQNMLEWAGQNLDDNVIDMFDAVMDSGNSAAAFFAVQALAMNYQDSVGVEGELLQGTAASDYSQGFRSQAELVQAMNDPRYESDAAYRNDIMRKLELSDIDF